MHVMRGIGVTIELVHLEVAAFLTILLTFSFFRIFASCLPNVVVVVVVVSFISV